MAHFATDRIARLVRHLKKRIFCLKRKVENRKRTLPKHPNSNYFASEKGGKNEGENSPWKIGKKLLFLTRYVMSRGSFLSLFDLFEDFSSLLRIVFSFLSETFNLFSRCPVGKITCGPNKTSCQSRILLFWVRFSTFFEVSWGENNLRTRQDILPKSNFTLLSEILNFFRGVLLGKWLEAPSIHLAIAESRAFEWDFQLFLGVLLGKWLGWWVTVTNELKILLRF